MKTIKTVFFAGIAAVLFAGAAHAQEVSVSAPWTRATVPQQRATGMFMQLKAAQDMTLVGARSDAAEHTEIHEMVMEGDVMKMREIKQVALPAGQAVEFKPGGLHVMFLDLKQQVRAGDSLPVTLTFKDAQGKEQTTRVDVPVRALNAPADSAGQTHQPAAHSHH